MKKQFLLSLFSLAIFSGNLFAQVKMGNNPTTIGASSVLEIESTNKGVLFPRMTGAQMIAIASPVSGMYIYNTDSLCLCQYNGTAWRSMCGTGIGSPDPDWHITGNTGTTASTAAIGSTVNNNFIGTTDVKDFVLASNNLERMRIASGGNVGLGVTTPFTNLNVRGTTAANPNSSGTTSTGLFRIDAQNNALDMGAYPNSPWGNWIQATAVADLSTKLPLTLNPNGGLIGIGVHAPLALVDILSDASPGGAYDNINLRSFGTSNPALVFQSGSGTAATPGNLSTGNFASAIATLGQVNGSLQTLNVIRSVYTGSGTTNKSEFQLFTSGIEHTRLDSIGRVMQAINTSVIPNGPMTSYHMYGDGTSNYQLLGTTNQPNPSEGPEIGFSRGGFFSGVGAAIQFVDYDAYSGGLAFLVHKGTRNGANGVFADNWPLDVVQAMTIENNGRIGIGTGDPTANFHIMAGAATVGNAPLKFTAGPASQTILEAGAVNYNGSDLTLSDATYAYTLTKTLSGSATLDFPSRTSVQIWDLTITVNGAALGDPVILGIPHAATIAPSATATYTAWVSAANTVTVRFSPKATENPASGVFTVRVVK